MILRRIFEKVERGFYIDVGAHHPKRFSNTYYFYRRGWRGINIDARPGSMEEFNRARPRDINVEAAIARERKELTYYMFDEPAVNSFDRGLSQQREHFKVTAERVIVTQRLDELLARHLPDGVKVNFMSVDVEGLDLEVLQSADWQRVRPEYLLVECLNADLERIHEDPVCQFLKTVGYRLYGKGVRTVFFKEAGAE